MTGGGYQLEATTTPTPPCGGRAPDLRAGREDGTTLVELLVTLLVTAIALAIVLPFVAAAGTASTTTSGVASATAAARLALQSVEVEVGSASAICRPTAAEVATPSYTCPGGGTGSAVRVLSDAFGTLHWVQWQVTGGALEEQTWANGATGSTVTPGAWNPVATSVVSPTPFSCTSSSPPAVLRVSLAVASGRGVGAVVVPVSSSIAALDTQYGSSPVSSC
ncbi:MAG: hypothetical protein ACYCXY_06175 [Acidimicrobiales bacterium]